MGELLMKKKNIAEGYLKLYVSEETEMGKEEFLAENDEHNTEEVILIVKKTNGEVKQLNVILSEFVWESFAREDT